MDYRPNCSLNRRYQGKRKIIKHVRSMATVYRPHLQIYWRLIHSIRFNLLSYSHIIMFCFLRNLKKRFVVGYWDWSHLKDCLLEDIFLEFHWFREMISLWNVLITKRNDFFILNFWVYKRTNQDIETILISFNVFSNNEHCL